MAHAQHLHFIDPEQLARIADLSLLARTVVEGFLSGVHRSPHSGSSIEFAQYRPYTQDDDPRRIDWKLYARTDRLQIKQHKEETNMRCTLLLDCSASMDYGSTAVSKFAYARMLTACLAMVLHKQRDAVGFIAYHREIATYLPPRNDPRHLQTVFVELDSLRPSGETNTPGALRRLAEFLKPRGMVVLVSDLLYPAEEAIDHLKSLRAMRHDVMVLQIADPAEQTFPFDHATTLVDSEDGSERFTIPDVARAEYLENRRRHFELIRRECLAAEIDIEEFAVSEPLDRALYFFLRRRNDALLTSSRRSRAGADGSRGGRR
jgi:uncharacterized protein (DUF58 family)